MKMGRTNEIDDKSSEVCKNNNMGDQILNIINSDKALLNWNSVVKGIISLVEESINGDKIGTEVDLYHLKIILRYLKYCVNEYGKNINKSDKKVLHENLFNIIRILLTLRLNVNDENIKLSRDDDTTESLYDSDSGELNLDLTNINKYDHDERNNIEYSHITYDENNNYNRNKDINYNNNDNQVESYLNIKGKDLKVSQIKIDNINNDKNCIGNLVDLSPKKNIKNDNNFTDLLYFSDNIGNNNISSLKTPQAVKYLNNNIKSPNQLVNKKSILIDKENAFTTNYPPPGFNWNNYHMNILKKRDESGFEQINRSEFRDNEYNLCQESNKKAINYIKSSDYLSYNNIKSNNNNRKQFGGNNEVKVKVKDIRKLGYENIEELYLNTVNRNNNQYTNEDYVIKNLKKQLHNSLRCKPCAHYFELGCKNGTLCSFCHHVDHSTVPPKKWKRLARCRPEVLRRIMNKNRNNINTQYN